jgi:hypothetical protein
LVLQGCEAQLLHLKEILHRVATSTGLVVNFHKSCLVLINMDQEKATTLASAFGCMVGSFCFTYLGLPMGLTKPQIKDYAPSSAELKEDYWFPVSIICRSTLAHKFCHLLTPNLLFVLPEASSHCHRGY